MHMLRPSTNLRVIVFVTMALCLLTSAPSPAFSDTGEPDANIQIVETTDPQDDVMDREIEVVEQMPPADEDTLEVLDDVPSAKVEQESVVSPEGASKAKVGAIKIRASARIQKRGWTKATTTSEGVLLGTTGGGLRLEALRIKLPSTSIEGGVAYGVHVEGIGWQESRKNGGTAGTVGEKRRIEAITLRLTGEIASAYDIWYRAHVQNVGWMSWAKNGQKSGTQGLSLRVEAIEVSVRAKGAKAPSSKDGSMPEAFINKPKLAYSVRQANAWQGWKKQGKTAGSTKGASIRSIKAKLVNGTAMRVSYSLHLSNTGWTPYVDADSQIGSSGTRMEAVRMRLRGKAAKLASVWYRVYVCDVGWTKWTRDGKAAGSVERGIAVSAIQAKVVARTDDAPKDGESSLPFACITKRTPQLLRDANANQKRLVRSARSTPWPGPGLCAGWVESVYQNAGINIGLGNANDLYNRYCKSANTANLKVGMLVGVSTHTRTSAGRIWGHVGIYVGDGWVMHSVTKKVKKVPLSWWIDYYGTTVRPKWGWPTAL